MGVGVYQGVFFTVSAPRQKTLEGGKADSQGPRRCPVEGEKWDCTTLAADWIVPNGDLFVYHWVFTRSGDMRSPAHNY